MKEELEALVEKFDLKNRTFQYFRKCYEDYLTDDITKDEAAGFGLKDSSSVTAEFYCYSFLVNERYSDGIIRVSLDIYRKGETIPFFEYDCLFDQNGKFEDDFFFTV